MRADRELMRKMLSQSHPGVASERYEIHARYQHLQALVGAELVSAPAPAPARAAAPRPTAPTAAAPAAESSERITVAVPSEGPRAEGALAASLRTNRARS